MAPSARASGWRSPAPEIGECAWGRLRRGAPPEARFLRASASLNRLQVLPGGGVLFLACAGDLLLYQPDKHRGRPLTKRVAGALFGILDLLSGDLLERETSREALPERLALARAATETYLQSLEPGEDPRWR